MDPNVRNILVFGGNGFIGSETVRCLLHLSNLNIVIVNRNKSWEWNTKEFIKSKVTCVKCDRDIPLSSCKELVQLVEHVSRFAAVIDFSGYNGKVVKEAVELLQNKTDLYIYTSSDSVYEVCEKTHDNPSKENDAVRPSSKDRIKKLKRQDSYGHKKLRGEEVLVDQLRTGDGKSGIPFVILRLADVIGPCDSTDRWWQYQLWIQLCKEMKVPMLLPRELECRLLSFVFVKDVAKIICQLVSSPDDKWVNNVFNLAVRETTTLKDFLYAVQQELHISKIEYKFTKDDVPWIYPSVDKGPMDITKAEEILQWDPVPLKDIIEETVTFYVHAVEDSKYSEERRDIMKTLYDDLKSLYPKEMVKKTLKAILKLN